MLAALALSVVVAAPVLADAPSRGPDKQYDDFTAGDQLITDLFTGLVWERGTSAAVTLAAATERCQNMGGSWRLPSMKELLTLVDEEPHDEYDDAQLRLVARSIDRSAFPKTPAEAFWTSSKRRDGDDYWTVSFADGTTGLARPSDSRRVRCVDAPVATP